MNNDTLSPSLPVSDQPANTEPAPDLFSCDQPLDCDQMFGIGSGIDPDDPEAAERRRLYINLKLSSSGQPTRSSGSHQAFLGAARDLLESYREKSLLLADYLCPPDQRIQSFIDRYLGKLKNDHDIRLPGTTLVLDRHGVARELSLPADGDHFQAEFVESYRVRQGVLHNTANDRRTTQGFFQIVEGGLPIPGDKQAVPVATFAHMLEAALHPPEELLRLPFTSEQDQQAAMFVSLLLRPEVCPAIPGLDCRKSMEIRFLAPGSLVSNLDFVESIFGNAGNPFLADNNAAIDIAHWTGHSGCVIIAPQLQLLTKKEVGLPPVDQASERQRADRMCWHSEDELYNDGHPFKLTARDSSGVILTLVTDNYFGYCKKEVKTQISFSANLFGNSEEEHAGGALAFPQRNHGNAFGLHSECAARGYHFSQVLDRYGASLDLHPQGHATDHDYPNLVFVPEDTTIDLVAQQVNWRHNGKEQTLRLDPRRVYMLPDGYKLQMQKYPGASSWRLVGADPEGTFCHKPCTVSGGGKSEISKSIASSIIYKPLFVNDLEEDLDHAQAIVDYDYSDRFLDPDEPHDPRPLLSADRSLGSVIKLLTPSTATYTQAYNDWLLTIPSRIRSLLFLVKRFYEPEWGNSWRAHFSVDLINGAPGHELKFNGRAVASAYLRVGFDPNGAWRIFKLRQDFVSAAKVQMEDDISASTVVATDKLPNHPADFPFPAAKLISNCEFRLFQRPDEAIHRGMDLQSEIDFTQPNTFLANYQALDRRHLKKIIGDTMGFDQFSAPMKDFLRKASKKRQAYTVSSAHPRMVDGKPSKNPRYLQLRPDVADPFATRVANMGIRLNRRVPPQQPICHPVDAVLTGRRNNPPEPGVRSLAVYNPIHYQELPELFMDFICSLTGKSPSTTGAGSEGALTKGPFNALRPIIDLNNALVSYILTDYPGFSSAAGHIGPDIRVDHDISMLVPEIWARLPRQAREPATLIEQGHLEALEDFEHDGRMVAASRLGYRITARFIHAYLGKIFDSPDAAFGSDILQPETQDRASFIDGIDNIVEAQQRVAQTYLEDGSIADACPPLTALLHIMANGDYQGKTVHDPQIRMLFDRDNLIQSDWYQQRLSTRQHNDRKLWSRHITCLETFLSQPARRDQAARLHIEQRLQLARAQLEKVSAADYVKSLQLTLGTDPTCRQG